ncbi:MAG: hypothetical protein RLO50_21600 [Azospirillaceae bacterium]
MIMCVSSGLLLAIAVGACQPQPRGGAIADSGAKPGGGGMPAVGAAFSAQAVEAAIDGYYSCLFNNPRGRIQVTSAGTMAAQELGRCAGSLANVEATLLRQPGVSDAQAAEITGRIREDARDQLEDAFQGF